MVPCGTLLFLAEIDRIKRSGVASQRSFSCNYPKARIVEEVLQQVGILDVLGRPSRLAENEFGETVRHWRFATSTTVEGSKLEPLLESLEGKVAAPLTEGLFVGLTEAMTNCAHHAYTDSRGDKLGHAGDLKRWWMFSQEKDGMLAVVFCDLGIGIPRSIVSSGIWNDDLIGRVMTLLGFDARTDSRLIRTALELRKTRTKLSHRGKGLPQILDVVRDQERGFLQIHSNRGLYRFDAPTKAEILKDFNCSIRGTLIQWQLPIPSGRQLGLDLGDNL